MSEKRKPQRSPTTELINFRFFENQKRQALTTELPTNEGEDADENYSSVTTVTPCDTPELNPPPPPILPTGPGSLSAPEQSGEGHAIGTSSTTPPSSSLAISAPSDKSRKGSVDQKIWNLVNLINGESNSFFTTSSCSGRIILYTWDTGSDNSSDPSKLKKGCKWLLVSHEEVQPDELINAYMSHCETEDSTNSGDEVYFKMEPCILHVQCRTLSNARKLIHLATESGFRNSGMVIGKENRITVAIRSAMGMEVPLPCSVESSNLISKEYLNYLAAIGNTKLRENWARNEKLVTLFSATIWKE